MRGENDSKQSDEFQANLRFDLTTYFYVLVRRISSFASEICDYSFFLFLLGIVGTLITGYLLEVFKSWDSVFNLNALVLVVGALAFLSLVTAKKIA